MSRVLRTTLPDGYFHVYALGVNKCAIFLDNSDRLRFLRLLRRSVERHGWTMHALCLMTTHYHLVLHATRAALSSGMQLLNGRYAQELNERHGRTGHLFGGRFSCRVVDDERYLAQVCEYVVANPVRAGLCESADDWPWSYRRREPDPDPKAYGPGLRATYQPTSIS